MRRFLEEQEVDITEYDERLTRRLIKRITVYDDHYSVEFKSGISVDIHK